MPEELLKNKLKKKGVGGSYVLTILEREREREREREQ